MARYFFNTIDSVHGRDTEGTELTDHAAARKHAIVFAGEVMHSEPTVLWGGRVFQVQIRDKDDLLLFTVTAYVTNALAAGDTK